MPLDITTSNTEHPPFSKNELNNIAIKIFKMLEKPQLIYTNSTTPANEKTIKIRKFINDTLPTNKNLNVQIDALTVYTIYQHVDENGKASPFDLTQFSLQTYLCPKNKIPLIKNFINHILNNSCIIAIEQKKDIHFSTTNSVMTAKQQYFNTLENLQKSKKSLRIEESFKILLNAFIEHPNEINDLMFATFQNIDKNLSYSTYIPSIDHDILQYAIGDNHYRVYVKAISELALILLHLYYSLWIDASRN